MSKIYDTIIQTLDELEMHYQRDDEHCMADMNIQCDCAAFHLRLAAMEEQEVLYCFASFPLNVPESKRSAMCELINAIKIHNEKRKFTKAQDIPVAEEVKEELSIPEVPAEEIRSEE